MSSSSDKEANYEDVEEKVQETSADETLAFINAHAEEFEGVEFTKKDNRALMKQIYIWLIPLVTLVNTVLYIDRDTLSYAVILGLYDSLGIDTEQYNDTNSVFYTGYFFGQILNFVLQKTSSRKFMTLNLFVWTVLIFLHCAATNFGGLIVLRFFLGFFESVVLPGIEVTLFQFLTPQERATINPIFWISAIGSSRIMAGFIAYGVLHINSSVPLWKIFMIINGGLTLIVTGLCVWIYPADPTDAHFLTTKQKYFLIKKVQKASSSAITQKTIKKHQIVECLKDPVSWLFTLYIFCNMLDNNLHYQQNLLYVSLGVTRLGSTLVSVVGACFASVWLIGGSFLIHYWPDHTAYIILISAIPEFSAGIAMITISWEKKMALLAMLVLAANTFALAYISCFGWLTSSAAGNTKKFFRHFMWMLSYSVSNVVAPQLWTGHQAPRYYHAWIVQIVFSWVGCSVLGFVIRFVLQARNKKRHEYLAEHGEAVGTVVRTDEEGHQVVEKVDIAILDLTDLENKRFIYPL